MLVQRQLLFIKIRAKIVGIIDKEGGLINENGFTFEEVCDLFLNKKGNNLNALTLSHSMKLIKKFGILELMFSYPLRHPDLLIKNI